MLLRDHRSVKKKKKAKTLTVKYFQGIKLLFTLKCVHEDGDVVVQFHFNTPRACLGVKVVAWVTGTEDDSRRFRPDFIRRALC